MIINIRSYSHLDHDAVWRIHLLAVGEAGVEPTHQHYHDILNIDELYLNSGGDFLVGVDEQGMVIAMGGIKKINNDLAEIKRLRIHPQFQKQGHGQRLLTTLENRALELGYRHLYLDTLHNQYGAQHLFTKNGYVEKRNTVIDGFDVIVYEKNITALATETSV